MSAKTRVVVLYGGRSTEHEVSCRSAAFVLRNLDPSKYDVRAVAIDKSGNWLPQDTQKLLANLGKTVPIEAATGPSIRPSIQGQPALPADRGGWQPTTSLLTSVVGERGGDSSLPVIFPVLHGSFGEDGTLQGMLELMGLPFVGPDTLGSAIGMDKAVTKRLAAAAGVAVVPWVEVRRQFWNQDRTAICQTAEKDLGWPMFVKPARLGSSVGVSRVKSREDLVRACEKAFEFDDKILIEKGLDVREIECAVLGDYDPEVSVPGEVIPQGDFYSYEKKYIDANGAAMGIPANLTPAQTLEAQSLSKKIFMALELYGMTRVDLFLEKNTGKFWLNEVNTLPGMTEISQYPLLWQASGIGPRELLDRLVALAQKRHSTKSELKRSFDDAK